jgi:putative heme transporter
VATSPGGTTLRRAGSAAWSWLGIIAVGAVVVAGLSAIAGFVVPFVVAVVIAMLLVPLVDRLAARGVSRSLGSLLVLAGFLGIFALVIVLAVEGVASQWSTVTRELGEGLAAVAAWLVERGVEVESPTDLLQRGFELVGALAAGASGTVAGALGSLTSFLFGTFIALFLLYLMLTDWHRLTDWVGRRLWVTPVVGAGIVEDVVGSLRGYYLALTISSALVSVVIAGTAWLLGIPLALAIGVVTFVTSYVPYIGAFVSAAFAVLIALGATGPVEAAVMLVVILLVQNVVQTVVQAKLTGDVLRLHPVVTFSVSIIGAGIAGALGASLAVPVVAATRRVVARLREHRDPQPEPPAHPHPQHLLAAAQQPAGHPDLLDEDLTARDEDARPDRP